MWIMTSITLSKYYMASWLYVQIEWFTIKALLLLKFKTIVITHPCFLESIVVTSFLVMYIFNKQSEAVSRARRKGATKVFKHGRKSPLDHFQKVKRMLRPDWAQKMVCIIVPNRRTVSPEFFSWVRTRRLLSRDSCPGFVHQAFLTRNEGTTGWVEKRLRCYRQLEQFNLSWENSVSDGSQCIVNNRKFKMQRRRESKKKQ